jgi:hypothetical protein
MEPNNGIPYAVFIFEYTHLTDLAGCGKGARPHDASGHSACVGHLAPARKQAATPCQGSRHRSAASHQPGPVAGPGSMEGFRCRTSSQAPGAEHEVQFAGRSNSWKAEVELERLKSKRHRGRCLGSVLTVSCSPAGDRRGSWSHHASGDSTRMGYLV